MVVKRLREVGGRSPLEMRLRTVVRTIDMMVRCQIFIDPTIERSVTLLCVSFVAIPISSPDNKGSPLFSRCNDNVNTTTERFEGLKIKRGKVEWPFVPKFRKLMYVNIVE